MTEFNKIKESTRRTEKLLVDLISDQIFAMAVAKAPFLGYPLIKTVVRYFMDKFLYWMSEQGIIYFNTAWVRIRVGKEAERLEQARQDALWAMDQGLSEEELREIEEEMINAFDDLVRFGRNPL